MSAPPFITQTTNQNEAIIRAAQIDQTIFQCVKKTLSAYVGSTMLLFLYNCRTKRAFRDAEIPASPEDLEESLDHMFDEASTIVKKAIISEVSAAFGLPGEYNNLKEAFESARNKGMTSQSLTN